MQLDRRDIESALSQKGFRREDTHHKYFYHEYEGKRTGVHTYTSHGSERYKVYTNPLLHSMRQQLQLDSVAQLANLVNCTMSGDDYNVHLKEKGLLGSGQKTAGTSAQSRKTQKHPKFRRRR